MAELYLAQDTSRGNELVVIKRILPYLSHEPDFVQMFLDEARIASQLHHPNVVRVHELGSLEGSIFISMEYVEGHDLRKILTEEQKRGSVLPYGIAAWVTAQVAAGLHYAHVATGVDGRPLQVIHRDVSPQNVMLGFDGRVKLVDFGIAKAGALMERSKPGVIKGKFLYLAPEQLTQERLDHRADLFSLGTMLYELTTGKSPFQRGSTEAIIFAIKGDEPDPPERHRPDYPRELSRIILKCLKKDRSARYQSGAEVQADLEAYLRSSPARPSQQLLARHIAELFGLEDERTVVHLAGADAEPEVTQTLPPTSATTAPGRPSTMPARGNGTPYDPDDDPRTQAVKPSELAAAIAGRTPSLVALPVRRATSTELPAVGGAPEPTVPLRGAPGVVMSSSSAPTVPPSPEEAEVTAQLPQARAAPRRLSSDRLPPPVPDEAEPTSRVRPSAQRAPSPEEAEVTAQLPPARSVSTANVFTTVPARRASRPATPSVRAAAAAEPGEASHLGDSVSVTEEGGTPPGVRRRQDDGEETANLGHEAPSRPLMPGVLLGIGVLLAVAVIAALFWPSGAPELRPMRALETSDPSPPARVVVSAPVPEPSPGERVAANPAEDSRPLEQSPAREIELVFRSARGTALTFDGKRIEPNASLRLPIGDYAWTYRCPGRRQKLVSRVLQVRADGPSPLVVSVPCRSR